LNRAYKFRIYPTEKQAELIRKTAGSARFIYNHFLDDAKTSKYQGYTAYATRLKELKAENPWLREADSIALQQALKNLETAFDRFFRRLGNYPKFKKKHKSNWSYRTMNVNNNIRIKDSFIQLPKLGLVRAVFTEEVTDNIKNATVSVSKSGKYYVSVCVETEHVVTMPHAIGAVGIDLGISSYAVMSNGEEIENPRHYLKNEKKLARLQRKHSKKQSGSKNRDKSRIKIARLSEKIANSRKDFQHKLSKRLVRENQTIVVEGLKVKNMIKNRKFSKHVQDAAWGQFSWMLKYKSEWHGRTFVKIDPFFPSSQKCSACGSRNPEVKDLKVRQWTCPDCGAHHDRDLNAAVNILNEGLSMTI